MDKVVYVFAGPNGSGKSSVVDLFSQSGILPSRYVCPDNLVRDMLRKEPSINVYDAYMQAMSLCEKTRMDDVRHGQPFAFETVFSNPDKLKFLRFAKAYGFHIVVIYITTADPAINVRRVQRRVSEGGHDVPEDKIRTRYERSMKLMPEVISLADEAEVYDNSVDEAAPKLVFKKMPSGRMFGTMKQGRTWLQNDLIEPLTELGYVVNMTIE